MYVQRGYMSAPTGSLQRTSTRLRCMYCSWSSVVGQLHDYGRYEANRKGSQSVPGPCEAMVAKNHPLSTGKVAITNGKMFNPKQQSKGNKAIIDG